ncbi:uncharacterized protein LOC104912985 isoform X2 [Meleagris gallopavo]|uniref:uncharacterized protein LOC104912985 isoform X2 n=1 Tax=Meleagris gallopavo TaxID=9103 RepID=UPI000549BD3E|nr:uncharacterized protein LOC104912985 isoform X2 [Meleagris gallopavo]
MPSVVLSAKAALCWRRLDGHCCPQQFGQLGSTLGLKALLSKRFGAWGMPMDSAMKQAGGILVSCSYLSASPELAFPSGGCSPDSCTKLPILCQKCPKGLGLNPLNNLIEWMLLRLWDAPAPMYCFYMVHLQKEASSASCDVHPCRAPQSSASRKQVKLDLRRMELSSSIQTGWIRNARSCFRAAEPHYVCFAVHQSSSQSFQDGAGVPTGLHPCQEPGIVQREQCTLCCQTLIASLGLGF